MLQPIETIACRGFAMKDLIVPLSLTDSERNPVRRVQVGVLLKRETCRGRRSGVELRGWWQWRERWRRGLRLSTAGRKAVKAERPRGRGPHARLVDWCR